MSKYLTIFRLGIHDALAYRGQVVIWCLHGIVWTMVFPFIWLTVFGTQEFIAGYSRQMMITYFILVAFIDSALYCHAYDSIHRDIKDGTVSNYLTKPVNYLLGRVWEETGYKVVRIIVTLAILAILFPLYKSWSAAPSGHLLIWILPAAIFARVISCLFAGIIGMVAFWTTQGEWLKHFYWMTTTFAAGYIAPISFYPETIQKILAYSPFPLIIQTPVNVLLGNISVGELFHTFLIGIIWIFILSGINYLMWKRGIRRVEGIGL